MEASTGAYMFQFDKFYFGAVGGYGQVTAPFQFNPNFGENGPAGSHSSEDASFVVVDTSSTAPPIFHFGASSSESSIGVSDLYCESLFFWGNPFIPTATSGVFQFSGDVHPRDEAADDVVKNRLRASPSVPPNAFICPLTQNVMVDPVILYPTGRTYEREAITDWFKRGNRTCPKTGEEVDTERLMPNVSLREVIEDWRQDLTKNGSAAAMSTLQEVDELVKVRSYADALAACLSGLSGPECVIARMRELIVEWKRVERYNASQSENELRSALSLLNAARDKATALQQLKERRDAELDAETRRRQELEKVCKHLQEQIENINELLLENQRLHERVRDLVAMQKARKSPSQEELAKQLAALECAALRCHPTDNPSMLKRKLCLKWHPDKQASDAQRSLATRVLQEMQNRPEWYF